ncbi:carboxymuconolactone decarboxylase family protein [Pseudonocardia sp. CA-107938]|uniref:carboxymuconolactone decarboxylase family protein n=1 Tax=Pseudonocardia sp. CA-107938 TaxID=3240021 RepID=UPI003D89CFB3
MTIRPTTDGRLPLVDIDSVEGPVGVALRASARLNIIAMMAHAPTCVLPQLAIGRAVMTEQSLPALQRELLILLAARMDGGRYVWAQHRSIAEGLGATSAALAALDALDTAATVFDDAERAILAFGVQVVRGGDVDDAVFERARQHFTAQQIVEAILAIGYYMTMNRLTNATRTPLEPVRT